MVFHQYRGCQMLDQAAMVSTIRSIPWFNELSSECVQQLALIAEPISVEQGEIIYSEGCQHGYLYIILDGRVQVESYVPGYGLLPIHFSDPLDVIGWSSLTPVVRQNPGCAKALAYSRLLAFHAEELTRLCKRNTEIGYIVMRRLANIVASSFLNHRLKLIGLITPNDQTASNL